MPRKRARVALIPDNWRDLLNDQREMLLSRIARHSVVRPSGCREWIGHNATDQYPKTDVNLGSLAFCVPVHRLLSAIFYNLDLKNTADLSRHSCDNTKCVEIAHLLRGSNQDNVRDAIERNRHFQPIGEQHGNSKLTANLARAIKERLILGHFPTQIARELDVSFNSVYDIRRGKTWRHVPWPPLSLPAWGLQ